MSAADRNKTAQYLQSHHPKSLSAEDQARVHQYLNSPNNQVERAPFKPLKLLGWLMLIIIGLGIISRELGNYFLDQLFGG